MAYRYNPSQELPVDASTAEASPGSQLEAAQADARRMEKEGRRATVVWTGTKFAARYLPMVLS